MISAKKFKLTNMCAYRIIYVMVKIIIMSLN